MPGISNETMRLYASLQRMHKLAEEWAGRSADDLTKHWYRIFA